jgi:hypothetical protein
MSLTAKMEVPTTLSPPRFQKRVIGYSAIALYALLAVITGYRHEPWADESQSWLLARDSTLIHLWTRLLHYEGTPGLWQTLLHVLIRLGFPYGSLNFISVAAGIGAVWLLVNYAPLPVYVRVTLPFTYYLFYQYGVIARSYSLLPLLTFGCAILYPDGWRRPYLFTLMVCLLAAVSLGGFVLAVLIYGDFLLHRVRLWHTRPAIEQKRMGAAVAAFLVTILLTGWSAWPASDNIFVRHLNLSPSHLVKFSLAMVQYAFTGEWVTTILAIGLSLPFLFGAGALPLFIAATLCLSISHSLIYMHVWHVGALFLTWVFCMWRAAASAPLTSLAAGSFALVIALQGYWTLQSTRYDWDQPYSGSREAASYLKEHPQIGIAGLYLAGFSTEAVKPYFSAADISRMTRSNRPAYWDWSAAGTGNDPLPLLASRFAYLLAGYKLRAEQAQWAVIAKIGGFQLARHFEGNLYWRTSILEPESFDLYRRVGGPDTAGLVSSIDIADPATARQLITGFYDLEANAWRWTARSFSIALRRPAGAEPDGARLTLHLAIPETQIGNLGPMTLSAEINGHALEPERFSSPGDLKYVREVPADDLSSALTLVTFTLDKSRTPSGEDDRDLGVIVKAVLIENK